MENRKLFVTALLLFAIVACGTSAMMAQLAPSPKKPSVDSTSTHYRPNPVSKRATMYYSGNWGVDSLSVKAVESGELIRFSYHVLDPEKALLLTDKKIEPSLVAPRAGVKLVIPYMEKVGPLRQSAPPEAGKTYWMAFSNSGRHVKRGDRVIIIIGQFRADGLVVE